MKKLVIFPMLLNIFAFGLEGEFQDAPNFSIEDVDGNVVNLEALREKGPVLMSCWALWC